MKLEINVTRKHIRKALYCGKNVAKHANSTAPDYIATSVTTNCAVAVACQEIFPWCDTINKTINNYSRLVEGIDSQIWEIQLDREITRPFMSRFDKASIFTRLFLIKPISLRIEISDYNLPIILEEAGMNLDKFLDQLTESGHITLID